MLGSAYVDLNIHQPPVVTLKLTPVTQHLHTRSRENTIKKSTLTGQNYGSKYARWLQVLSWTPRDRKPDTKSSASYGTESWANRGSVSDVPLSNVLDENFLHASIFDVFALVTSFALVSCSLPTSAKTSEIDAWKKIFVKHAAKRCVAHWSSVSSALSVP